MRMVLIMVVVAGLGACAHGRPAPQTLAGMHESADWANEDGDVLQTALQRTVAHLARDGGRAAALLQVNAAGYECTYGEAHEDYPEPAAVCTRSFASRACQFDWEVTITSDPARPDSIDSADAGFRRDCVGTARDWPEPVISAIDDGLARAEPPDPVRSKLETPLPDMYQGPIF
ncbi:hypothetical protein [Hyphomonas sp.]|uniref:hypothetical protein n=1 Tax=Hyphomonas sp. TaxID=87 RepID=UPI00391B8F8A